MNRRILRLVIATVAGLVGLVLLSTFIGTAASADRPAVDVDLGASDGGANWSIRAARMITIPYGISSTLEMDVYGDQVIVTGHGECKEDSSGTSIGVVVSQEGADTLGGGHTEDDCRGGKRFVWEAEAEMQGTESFDTGQAKVCAVALELNWSVPPAYIWCKEVTLQ